MAPMAALRDVKQLVRRGAEVTGAAPGATARGRMNPKWLVGGVLVALLLSALAVRLLVEAGPPPASRAEAFAEGQHTLEPLWPAPAFAYPDQSQALVTPQALAGRPYVANFIFTQCRTICPLLTAKMVQVQRQLAGAELRFVSFSVDPAHDTPAVLAAYAKTWHPEETRWHLLATDERTLPLLAAGFHVTAEKGKPGELDPIIHSAVFVLVDGAGLVRGVYDSEHREDFRALVGDARALAKAPPQPPPGPRTAEALYHELSCVACHERPELAPLLGGMAGHRRELSTGLVVEADAAYVRESLLAPDAKRVAGYPLKMPSYDGLVEGAALDDLVAYVLALPPKGAPEAGVTVAVDPVCHMEVRATADALKAEVDGGAVYFCSGFCRDRYLAHPDAFRGP